MGVSGGASRYIGDYAGEEYRPKASFSLGAALNSHFALESESGYRGLMVPRRLDDYSFFSDLSLRYVFLPHDRISPFCSLGAGVEFDNKEVGLAGSKYLSTLSGKFGLEYMAGRKVGISVSSGWNYYLNDSFDGTRSGRYNDMNWGISVGMRFYFFKLRQKVAYF